jgi:hypothetical protein
MRTPITVFVAAMLSLFPWTKSEGAPFSNGSFESPGITSPNTFLALSSGDTKISNWIVGGTGGELSWINSRAASYAELNIDPLDGTHHISFNGNDAPPGRSISQTFSTSPGQIYVVTFYVARIGPGSGVMSLTADARTSGGQLLTSYVARPPASGYGAIQQFTFTPTSTETTLRFRDTSDSTNSVDILLDAVSVNLKDTQLTISCEFHAVIEVRGVVGQQYRVEFKDSLDDSDWLTVTTFALPVSPYLVLDPTSPGRPKRFYRAVTAP